MTTAEPDNHTAAASRISATTVALVLLLVVATLGPRLWGLSEMVLMEDECFHAELAERPWSEIIRHARVSPTYPGWYAPYKLWLLVAPDSDAGRKAFSVFLGCLGVLGMFCLGREAAGRRAGWIAALLLALNGYHINYSQTATPYALILLLGVLAAWSLLVALRRGLRWALLHQLVLASLFYVHPTAAFFCAAGAAALLLLRLGGRSPQLTTLPRSYLLLVPLATPAWLLMLEHWQVLRQSGGAAYIPEVSLPVVLERLHNLGAFGSTLRWAYPLEALALAGALAVGLWAVVRAVRRQDRRCWPATVLLVLWMLPFVAAAVSGALVNREIFYEARFFALFVPAGIALLAVAAVHLQQGLRRAGPVLAGLLLAAALIPQLGSLQYLFGGDRAADKFPVRQVLGHLQKHARAGDVAVVHHSWYLSFFRRYHRGPHPRVVGAKHQQLQHAAYGGVRDATTAADVLQVQQQLRGHKRLFLVLSVAALEEWRDPAGLLEADMDRRYFLIHRLCFNCDRFATMVKLYDLQREGSPPGERRRSP